MQLTKWDPFKAMEDLFDRYTKSGDWPGKANQEVMATGDWAPRVDISETDSAFLIKAEIPEVKKEDVTVTVDSGVLAIRGERKQEKEEKDKKYHRIERHYGTFMRSFTLPDNVDEHRIEANFKDGMLSLRIPKTAEAKAKVIDVKIQ